jgi:hypothetical protein
MTPLEFKNNLVQFTNSVLSTKVDTLKHGSGLARKRKYEESAQEVLDKLFQKLTSDDVVNRFAHNLSYQMVFAFDKSGAFSPISLSARSEYDYSIDRPLTRMYGGNRCPVSPTTFQMGVPCQVWIRQDVQIVLDALVGVGIVPVLYFNSDADRLYVGLDIASTWKASA